MKLVSFFLIVSIILESTLITLPLSLLIIIFSSIVLRKNEVFILAFFAGLFLDILGLRDIGLSSAFFVAIVFIVFLYQKKFEIKSLTFIAVSAFIASLGYLMIQGTSYALLQTVIATLIISASFLIFQKTNKKVLKYA
ncbi:MAG: hypothetical protein HY426_03195 [Candidatus Levybacteria bacterium]|nr:hypothetical protein [Candidatus Levybacteria bacterium]